MSTHHRKSAALLVVALLIGLVLAWRDDVVVPASGDGTRNSASPLPARPLSVDLPVERRRDGGQLEPEPLARIDVLVRNEGSHGHHGSARVRLFALDEDMQERAVTYLAEEGVFSASSRPGPHVVVVTERSTTRCCRIELPLGHSHFGFPGSPFPAARHGDVYVNVRWPSGAAVIGAAVEMVSLGRSLHATSNEFGDAVFREVPLDEGLTNVVHARLGDHHASVMLPAHDGTNPIGTFYPLTLRERCVRRVLVEGCDFTSRKGEIDLRRPESLTPMYVVPTPLVDAAFDLAAMPGGFVVSFTPAGETRAEVGSITIPEEPGTTPIAVVLAGRAQGAIVVEFAEGDGWLAVLPRESCREATVRIEWTAVGKRTARTATAGEYTVLAVPKVGKAVHRTIQVRRDRQVHVSVPGPSKAPVADVVCEVRGLEGRAVFVLEEVTGHPTAVVRLPVRGEDENRPSMLVKDNAGFAEVFCRGRGTFDWPTHTRDLVVPETVAKPGLDARWLLRGRAPQGELVWSRLVASGTTRTELDGALELVCGNGAVAKRAVVRPQDEQVVVGLPPEHQVLVVPTPSYRQKWPSPFVYVYQRDTEGEPGLANCTFTGVVLAATQRTEVWLPEGYYVLVGGTSWMDSAFQLSIGKRAADLRVESSPVECVLL